MKDKDGNLILLTQTTPFQIVRRASASSDRKRRIENVWSRRSLERSFHVLWKRKCLSWRKQRFCLERFFFHPLNDRRRQQKRQRWRKNAFKRKYFIFVQFNLIYQPFNKSLASNILQTETLISSCWAVMCNGNLRLLIIFIPRKVFRVITMGRARLHGSTKAWRRRAQKKRQNESKTFPL